MGGPNAALRSPGALRAVTAALAAAVSMLLVAPYLGMLWEWAAPAPTYINSDGAIYLNNQDTGEFIGADLWFLLLGLGAGLVAGGLGYWRYRRRLAVMIGLTAGALAGAFIARRVGTAFGPPGIAQAALGLANGATVHAMITVKARVVLLGWPVGVLVAYVSLIAGLERPAKRAARAGVESSTEDRDGASVRAAAGGDQIARRNGRQPVEDATLPVEQRELGA